MPRQPQPEPQQYEPPRHEPPRHEPRQHAPQQYSPEPPRPEPLPYDPATPGYGYEPGRHAARHAVPADGAAAEPAPGPVTPGPVTPGPVTPGPVTPGPVTPGLVTPGPATPAGTAHEPSAPGPTMPDPTRSPDAVPPAPQAGPAEPAYPVGSPEAPMSAQATYEDLTGSGWPPSDPAFEIPAAPFGGYPNHQYLSPVGLPPELVPQGEPVAGPPEAHLAADAEPPAAYRQSYPVSPVPPRPARPPFGSEQQPEPSDVGWPTDGYATQPPGAGDGVDPVPPHGSGVDATSPAGRAPDALDGAGVDGAPADPGTRAGLPDDGVEPTVESPADVAPGSTGTGSAEADFDLAQAPEAEVLAVVRGVAGVRDASLYDTPDRGRILRLDVEDEADGAAVGRDVARVLRDRFSMGAALARPSGELQALGRYPHGAIGDSPHVIEAEARGSSTSYMDGGTSGSGPRVLLERVQVAIAGLEAAVEVCLAVGGVRAVGRAAGPAVEGHVVRAAAAATADAVHVLLGGRARCAVEYVDVLPAGTTTVALAVLLLLTDQGPERLVGAAPVDGDARQASARAALAALNRRLETLLDE